MPNSALMREDLQKALANPDEWSYVDTADWDLVGIIESRGTKEKEWVQPDGQGDLWLAKWPHRDEQGIKGEDWAEWVVYRIAVQLGLPVAAVLAGIREGGVFGNSVSLSRRVLGQGDSLHLGNELLRNSNPGYADSQKRENPGYTVQTIKTALEAEPILPPRDINGFKCGDSMTAFDVFAGYLVLDAVVGGQDRNHENWAVIQHSSGERRLAPTFDHGNALGYQGDEEWVEKNSGSAIEFARRGKSRHFSGQPGLVDVAGEALSSCSPEAAEHWRLKVAQLDIALIDESIRTIPQDRMSDIRRKFITDVLTENQRRLA